MPPKRAKAQSLQDFYKQTPAKTSWADEEDVEEPAPQQTPKVEQKTTAPAPSAWKSAPTAHPLAKKTETLADEEPQQEVKKVPVSKTWNPSPSNEEFGERPMRSKPKYEQKEINEDDIPKESPFILFVGNLHFDVKKDDIREFFDGLEILNVITPIDKEKNKPKGFAYVEFADEENLRKAIGFKGQELMGRQIRVDLVAPEVAQKYCVANRPQSARRGGFSGPRPERKQFAPKSEVSFVKTEADENINWRKKSGPKPAQFTEAPAEESTEDSSEKKNPFGFGKPRGRGGFRGGRGRGGFGGGFGDRQKFESEDNDDSPPSEEPKKSYQPRKQFPAAFQTKKNTPQSQVKSNNMFGALNDETE